MNKYHRYVNLPFELERPPQANGDKEGPYHQDLREWRVPEMEEWLANLGCVVKHTEIFYTPAGGEIPIHTDELYLSDQVKFNTTWGPEEGKVIWWKGDPEKVSKVVNYLETDVYERFGEETVKNFSDRPDGVVVVLPEKEDCVKVYEASTNKTSMLNVGQLHSTSSPKTAGRWTLCFVPGIDKGADEIEYIQWDDALKIFNDYLEEGSE
jgi:hypothetical protein